MSVIPYSNACHVFLLKLNVVTDIIHEVDNLEDEGSVFEARLINAILINATLFVAMRVKVVVQQNSSTTSNFIKHHRSNFVRNIQRTLEVAEYMRSLEYRRAKEASQDHSVMKRNHLASINDASKQDKK
ncbi:uncharacterized protein LOC143265121 [Megachile rotundata]|uniref:uncharacterized protein LOC143265121 n=1 Tax=Megachile rotundata TaxID=143995 RepID=UPI003FCFFB34